METRRNRKKGRGNNREEEREEDSNEGCLIPHLILLIDLLLWAPNASLFGVYSDVRCSMFDGGPGRS